ncbi:cell wall metabolism sensor histidine kinase WalK [Alkalihalobacillus sp. MEB130]|uniref:two-component system histidine kinase PnpS n=1 Tax=Alkalihalobacillus sp. MEB130 TaxID=2976704 RepID=UPI0028DE269D|nr:ATP-binding protein [Alkalihalobacillus sp. MEB130]MDT8859423.1 cell wall metabolism sensor histidine kinase WalK [Alkalihalobacillus sp. MEB130]
MYKLRIKIMVAVLSITLLVLTGVGIVIGQLYQDFYINYVTERVEKEANLAAYMLATERLDLENAQKKALEISTLLDSRVTIIDLDGTVIGESAENPVTMDNHLDRPEIEAVEMGKHASYIRYSETVHDELLYYAVPILDENASKIGYLRLGLSTDTLAEMSEMIWWILGISFTVAFVIIVSITYRVTNEMTRPIESATVVANELAEGNYKARTSEGKRDEIGQLTRSINILAFNLEQLTKRHEAQKERMETLIDNMGSGLILINTKGDISLINRTCRDIFQENTDLWKHELYHDVIKHKEVIKIVQTIFLTEKKQRAHISFPVQLEVRHFDVYGAPVMSNRDKLKGIVLVLHDMTELKKLEQVRTDFVANVSHELKTPVTSIKGFTETLLDGAMNTESLREKFLTIIAKESERLQNLIQDLLDLSRIEQAYFQLNWQRTNLQVVVGEVFDLLKDKAKAKQIDLQVNTEGDVTLEGDTERIKQIAINLINNGIMYTPQGGSVHVSLKGEQDTVILEISDTGVGIGENELPRIFERFYRVDRARSRNSGGTGLGLAIVKHLVEAHHGKMAVTSKLGEGTTFTIKLKRYREE